MIEKYGIRRPVTLFYSRIRCRVVIIGTMDHLCQLFHTIGYIQLFRTGGKFFLNCAELDILNIKVFKILSRPLGSPFSTESLSASKPRKH